MYRLQKDPQYVLRSGKCSIYLYSRTDFPEKKCLFNYRDSVICYCFTNQYLIYTNLIDVDDGDW